LASIFSSVGSSNVGSSLGSFLSLTLLPCFSEVEVFVAKKVTEVAERHARDFRVVEKNAKFRWKTKPDFIDDFGVGYVFISCSEKLEFGIEILHYITVGVSIFSTTGFGARHCGIDGELGFEGRDPSFDCSHLVWRHCMRSKPILSSAGESRWNSCNNGQFTVDFDKASEILAIFVRCAEIGIEDCHDFGWYFLDSSDDDRSFGWSSGRKARIVAAILVIVAIVTISWRTPRRRTWRAFVVVF